MVRMCGRSAEIASEAWRDNPDHCHASSYRGDGECWWRECPAKDGVCPLKQMEPTDA